MNKILKCFKNHFFKKLEREMIFRFEDMSLTTLKVFLQGWNEHNELFRDVIDTLNFPISNMGYDNSSLFHIAIVGCDIPMGLCFLMKTQLNP